MKYQFEVEVNSLQLVEKLVDLGQQDGGTIKPLNTESKEAFESFLESSNNN